jgi:hypothetical protein
MDGIKPHNHMAGMDGDMEGVMGDFGVDKFHSPRVNGSGSNSMMEDPKTSMPHGLNAKMLGDSERAPPIGRGAGKMGVTAHADQGPHQLPNSSGNFGVRSMKSMNG